MVRTPRWLRRILENSESQEEWRIFRHRHQVSLMAAEEAGSIAARESLKSLGRYPSRAIPRRQRGSFWNYFPTSHATSLRGIVNAAFKMNEDRHSMLHTLYNKEILQKAVPMMVAGALATFHDAADPAGYLDFLPARGGRSFRGLTLSLMSPSSLRSRPSPVCLTGQGSFRASLICSSRQIWMKRLAWRKCGTAG